MPDLTKLAEKIDGALRQLYGEEMAFYLVAAPFNTEEAEVDHVFNCSPKSLLDLLVTSAEVAEEALKKLRAEVNQTH